MKIIIKRYRNTNSGKNSACHSTKESYKITDFLRPGAGIVSIDGSLCSSKEIFSSENISSAKNEFAARVMGLAYQVDHIQALTSVIPYFSDSERVDLATALFGLKERIEKIEEKLEGVGG